MSDELSAIGKQLGDVRLQRGDTLEDAANATRIRTKQLEAIEAGDPDPTLTEMQLRGLLRNYAAFLQLDFDAMLAAYRQALEEVPQSRFGVRLSFSRPAHQPVEVPVIPISANPTTQTPPYGVPRVAQQVRDSQEMMRVETASQGSDWPRLLGAMLAGMLLMAGLGIVGLLVIGADDWLESSPEGEQVTSVPLMVEEEEGLQENSFPKEAQPTPTQTPTPTPTQGASGVIVAPEGQQPNMTGAERVVMSVAANQRSWVRVAVDGGVEYEGLLRPGTALQYQAQESITLRTSNAGGLDVVVNNQDLGVLGTRGELYEETFSLEGMPPASEVPTNDAPAPLLPEESATPTPAAAQPQPTEEVQ